MWFFIDPHGEVLFSLAHLMGLKVQLKLQNQLVGRVMVNDSRAGLMPSNANLQVQKMEWQRHTTIPRVSKENTIWSHLLFEIPGLAPCWSHQSSSWPTPLLQSAPPPCVSAHLEIAWGEMWQEGVNDRVRADQWGSYTHPSQSQDS